MIQTSMFLYPFLSSFIQPEQFKHDKTNNKDKLTFSMQVIHYMQENMGANLTLSQLATTFRFAFFSSFPKRNRSSSDELLHPAEDP